MGAMTPEDNEQTQTSDPTTQGRPASQTPHDGPQAAEEAATAGQEGRTRPADTDDITGTADVGVVGLAVMGSNLARNMARHGYTVALYNRTRSRTEELVATHGDEGKFILTGELQDFVAALERPRRIVIMVQAGAGTDAVIDSLVPLLDEGDIVVDGGNAYYEDTRRREAALREHGLHFVGAGISGGEVGALEGPSIMPGGSPESYAALGPILEDISAKVDGAPCAAYMGTDGAGHFVKMIHNGIEYADMQFIGEAYTLLRGAGLSTKECADVFRTWNTGDLDSYLIEITAEVLDQIDAKTGEPLVDVITDAAGQKGTGTWTVQTALTLGSPVNTIAESVFARATSSHPELRAAAQAALSGPDGDVTEYVQWFGGRDGFVDAVRDALWSSKVIAYAQGLDEIRTAAKEYGWDIDVAKVAEIWRAGCIIRAKLLERIRSEYAAGNLVTLLEAPSVKDELARNQDSWRKVIAAGVTGGVPLPGFGAALAYYDLARAPRNNAALTQGLRDYFGAHTYQRIDTEGTFHTLWSGDRSEITV